MMYRDHSRVGGLSPRGRGNRDVEFLGQALQRSIPAWAGEPVAVLGKGDVGQVYPRVGGGTAFSRQRIPIEWGLSPRGRGNPWTM